MDNDKSTTQIYKDDLTILDMYRQLNKIETRRDALRDIFTKAGVYAEVAP